jgi:DNA repair protein RadA/Sms
MGEEAPPIAEGRAWVATVHEPEPIGQVSAGLWAPAPTGVAEVDRVLGGGLVPGSVTLLGGEPGIGKSTLLLQVLAGLARDRRCLLVAAEESPQQVRLRAERLKGWCLNPPQAADSPVRGSAERRWSEAGRAPLRVAPNTKDTSLLETVSPDLWVVAEADLATVLERVSQVEPRFLVIDSVQALSDGGVSGAAGSVSQVRHCAHQLVRLAKERTISTVLVGHVTKDGSLAGPRVLEHMVDTVLSFSGDRHHALRLLRAVKHRFGPTSEVGLFEMGEGGLEGVDDAGHLFLADRLPGVAGSVVVPAIDGNRPLMVELQALVVPAPQGAPPRRSAQGVDGGRLALLLAVLDRRSGVRTPGCDVYAMAAGGARVTDPGADLPLALAVASSACNRPLPPDLVACGEVGLGGELRQVPHLGRRMAEAARLGFRSALVPASAPEPPPGMVAMRASTLSDALDLAGLDARQVGLQVAGAGRSSSGRGTPTPVQWGRQRR